MTNYIIKRFTEGTKSNFYCCIEKNNKTYLPYKELEKLLSDNWIKYDPVHEFIACKNTILSEEIEKEITDSLLNVGLVIYKKSAYKLLSTYCTVKAQYDEPYNKTSNQCSWVAAEIVKRKDEIIQIIKSNNKEKLIDIYKTCLDNGTNNRIKYGNKIEGENIDDLIINNNLNSTELKTTELKTIIYGNQNILNSFDPTVLNMIIKSNFKNIPYNQFIEEIKLIPNDKLVIINRDGQTFVFIKINNFYYVLDSHIRNIYKFDFLNFIEKIILEDNLDGFFYILYGII
jgi:hypothetical protein